MSKNTSPKANDALTNVTIVDGKMILSLPNAKMPVVWQMDLEQVQSSAFTVKEDKKAKSFTLILKTQDGNIDEIASFDDKQSAVDILMETSTVLQSAHGKIKPGAIASNSNALAAADGISKNDKTGAMLTLALIVVLGFIWMISASGNIRTEQSSSTASSSNPLSSSNARDSSGVPVSADDFLSNR